MVEQRPGMRPARRVGQQLAGRAARQPSRYAELTYTSFDDGVGGGGWQIKQTRGDLTDEERRALRSQVSTRLDAGVELPRFPTPEEIAQFPRRLAYSPVGPAFAPGAAAWWHTAEAGADASGRPGNVFCHVVLDRTPEQPPSFRPIDLWRSASWLTPYGPEQVAAAELSPQLPSFDDALGVDEVIDFCFADFDRISVLGPLLDACAAARAGGPRVILVVNAVERAAQWIAAVSRLTSAPVMRRLYFSTLERHSGIGDGFRNGVQLVCLPGIDLDAVDHDRRRLSEPTVLLSEDEFPELGDLGRPDEPAHPHVTQHGDRIAVTPWSVLARIVLEAESPEQARTVLGRIDRIAGQVAGLADGVDYAPDWPLAMSIALSGEEFVEAHPEAALVIGRRSPSGLDRLPELYRRAVQLVSTRCGESTAEAWDALRATMSDTDDSDDSSTMIGTVLIFDNYLRRLIADHEWLGRPDGVPLPEVLPAMDRDSLLDSVREQVDLLGSRGDSGPDRRRTDPMVIARLADVLIRTGLVDEQIVVQLRSLAYPVGTALTTSEGPALIGRIGAVAEETLRRVIRPSVILDVPQPTALGRQVDPDVLRWLYPQPPEPIALRTIYDHQRVGSLSDDYWLRAERDWAAYAAGGRHALGQEAGYAAWTLLDATERFAAPDGLQPSPTRSAGPDWSGCLPLLVAPIDPDDLYCLLHRYEPGRRVAIQAAAATLLAVPWSDDPRSAALQQLCRRLQQKDRSDADPQAIADDLPRVREWLADRSWATAWWASRTATIMNTVNAWIRRIELTSVDDLAPDVCSGMAAVLIIELIQGRSAADVAGLMRVFAPERIPVDVALTETVAAVINSSVKVARDHRDQAPPTVIGPAKLLAAVVQSEPSVLDGRIQTEGARWLARWHTRRDEPLLESLLTSWLQRADDKQQRRVRDETVALLQKSLSAADNTRELERAVATRLKHLRRRSGS